MKANNINTVEKAVNDAAANIGTYNNEFIDYSLACFTTNFEEYQNLSFDEFIPAFASMILAETLTERFFYQLGCFKGYLAIYITRQFELAIINSFREEGYLEIDNSFDYITGEYDYYDDGTIPKIEWMKNYKYSEFDYEIAFEIVEEFFNNISHVEILNMFRDDAIEMLSRSFAHHVNELFYDIIDKEKLFKIFEAEFSELLPVYE